MRNNDVLQVQERKEMSNIKTFNARKNEGQLIYQDIKTINKSITTA